MNFKQALPNADPNQLLTTVLITQYLDMLKVCTTSVCIKMFYSPGVFFPFRKLQRTAETRSFSPRTPLTSKQSKDSSAWHFSARRPLPLPLLHRYQSDVVAVAELLIIRNAFPKKKKKKPL